LALMSETIKQIITEIRPGIIATANKDGKPNVSAKGSLRVLDDEHVIFADMSSPRTTANLRENPQVSILIFHPKTMRGCRIWGKAEVMDSGDVFENLRSEYDARNIKVNHVIKIAVEETQESF